MSSYLPTTMHISQHTKGMRVVVGMEEDIAGIVGKDDAFFGPHTQ